MLKHKGTSTTQNWVVVMVVVVGAGGGELRGCQCVRVFDISESERALHLLDLRPFVSRSVLFLFLFLLSSPSQDR